MNVVGGGRDKCYRRSVIARCGGSDEIILRDNTVSAPELECGSPKRAHRVKPFRMELNEIGKYNVY